MVNRDPSDNPLPIGDHAKRDNFQALPVSEPLGDERSLSDDPFVGLPDEIDLANLPIPGSENALNLAGHFSLDGSESLANLSDGDVSRDLVSAASVSTDTSVPLSIEHADVGGIDASDEPIPLNQRKGALYQAAPGWLVSLLVHVALLLILAAFQLEPLRESIGILTSNPSSSNSDGLEEFDIQGPDLDVADTSMDEPIVDATQSMQDVALPEVTSVSPLQVSTDASSISNMVESILPSSALSGASSRLSSSLSSRSSAMKGEMLERYGGNASSEKAVSTALKWIAAHQARNGGWTFGHSAICRGQCKDDGDIPLATNAATALAILPFLGAGQTHVEGSYKETVKKGLAFLINSMKVQGSKGMGSWHEPGGSMYSHGLASIAVCEAYAMTRDPDLLQPAQLALNFIVDAQHPQGGGWRYAPKQAGDTSVVGWQLMAMKSGAMGNLTVPIETFRKANSFLDSMSVNNGAYYGYDKPTSSIEGRQSTTAVGLLCRMYLGWPKDHPGMKEGIAYLAKRGPSVEDVYYSYYATQVLRQHGGQEWERWNKAMRDGLIKAQETEGHAAGSWYSRKGHNVKGGRLYCTSMSTMILEVYYRHMPLYSDKSADDDFEL